MDEDVDRASRMKRITVQQALVAIVVLFFLGMTASLFPFLTIVTIASFYALYVLVSAVIIRLVVKWVKADPRSASRV